MSTDVYKVRRLERKKDIVVEVPGSKSITNRALLLAALSDGITILKGTLFSDDSRYFLKSLKSLGFLVDIDQESKTVIVEGKGGKIPNPSGEINVGSAGTAARFLTAMLGLSGGTYTINASEQMKKRPMRELFAALERLGVKIKYIENEYHLPVVIEGRADNGVNNITLDTNESTQFLSAMLMTGVMNEYGISIRVTGERKTGAYVNITRKMMGSFGLKNVEYKDDTYYIKPMSKYNTEDGFIYQIEPDVSAACYFYGIGAVTGIRTIVKNVFMSSMQGDIKFVQVLKDMGCTVEKTDDGISVRGPVKPDRLKGIDIDMNNFSDQALTMAAVSIFADGPVTIRNIGHIRMQESDRLSGMACELKKMGIRCEEKKDKITIYPGTPKPCSIETYEDHRMAMAFTIPGLITGNMEILNPMCCRKTFENYFQVIDSLYE